MQREVIPIQYCDFSQVDHLKVCPLFTQLLSKKDGSIQVDDIDVLHEEIQSLLTENGRRLKLLENETQVLNDWQDRRDKRKLPKSHSGKRSQFEASSSQPDKKQKLLADQSEPSADDEYGTHVYQRPRTEVLHRFWASVEPFCRDITTDDISELQSVLSPIEDSERNYYSIPPLGKHYSERWAEEDLLEEQRDNSRLTERRNKSSVLVDKSSAEKLLKHSGSENISADDPALCPFGVLTQRLLSALVDENPSVQVEDCPDGDTAVPSPTKSGGRVSHRPVPLSHAKLLETRIKEELTHLGLLECNEVPELDIKNDKDLEDEVLAELKKKQEELRSVAAYNRQQRDRLIQAAEEEMKQQVVRNQILKLDTEIVEIRQRLLTLKAKKKALSKKEKDSAWRAVRERNRLLSQLHQSDVKFTSAS